MVEKMNVMIILVAVSAIVITAVVTGIVLGTKSHSSRRSYRNQQPLTVVLKDNNFLKPYKKLNAEYELIKLSNGMTGLLINDPYAEKSHIQMSIPYGAYIDTVQGITHFGEHMVLEGSEKYPSLYPLDDKFSGIQNYDSNGFTGGDCQIFYISLPFNYQYENAIDLLSDSFRYPLYEPNIIKNEIQAVNHEFYDKIYSFSLLYDLLRQLSNKNTSYYGMSCGNNETLKVEESELLSKKLKGYHMLIKNPKNIFFTLYSNYSINKLENYSKQYLNYNLHKFSDNEIDVEDQKKLEENIKSLKNDKIFDETIFKHGFYFNSNTKNNILEIIYYIGEIDSKELKFDIVDYINYLFNSESLIKILKKNSYVIDYKVGASRFDYLLPYNNYFLIELSLTEEGLLNINDILIIINKYIELIKKEGFKKEYYNNFANCINNKDILKFTKEQISDFDYFLNIFYNYYFYENNNILVSGAFSENDYNQELLKKYLNKIKYEQSFYGINTRKNISELVLDDIIKNKETRQLKYYKIDFIIGTIPDEISEKINDENNIIENLEFRKINTYVSKNYKDKVIPCYKEEINKCSENNEFDYENDEKYNSTKLEDSDIYETYYQIDKSSESHLVYSNIKFILNAIGIKSLDLIFLRYYFRIKLSEISEVSNTINNRFNSKQIECSFKTFSDNTEKIINKFINLIKEEILEEDFESLKLMVISYYYSTKTISFESYLNQILQIFLGQREANDNFDIMIQEIEELNVEYFQSLISKIFNNIKAIQFKIAGNINKSLVQNIHNNLKNNFIIETNNNNLLKQTPEKDDLPYVYNYYQISTYNNPENGILVHYDVPENLTDLFTIFNKCFTSIAYKYLRFNYTNAYGPLHSFQYNEFVLYEHGLFKDVDEMEDDINKLFLDIINKKITINNYKEIIESFNLESTIKQEKNLENLFDEFVSGSNENINSNTEEKEKNEYPKSFEELVELIAPVFTNPKRITILIAKKDISEENFEKMLERRSQNKKYLLNETIEVKHTTDINYLIN